MGSGKTTAGKKLAQKLDFTFVDLDTQIEKQQQKTIAQIFEEKGEAQFRKIEQRALHDTINLRNAIISTGGGVPCFFDNMQWMNKNGTTVYIELSAKALLNRLKDAKNERPLIKNKTHEELLAFIENTLEHRQRFYEKAQITVNGIDLNTEKIISKL